MEADSVHIPRSTFAETLYVVFLRVVAMSCLWFGLQYWAMLIGYSLHGAGRFDLLSVPWKVAASSLAVIFPVAALGLWISASWGAVIWTLAAGSQVLMHGVWSGTYGFNRLILTTHVLVVAVYLLFRLVLWLEGRHRT